MGKIAVPLSILCVVVVAQGACTSAGGDDLQDSAALSTTVTEPATSSTTEPATTSTTEPSPIEITIAAAGDLMIHKATLRSAKAAGMGGSYDFKPTFTSVAPYLRVADYAVVNLETRLAGSDFAYTSFPRFNCPDELTEALNLMGVDLCATANNHALDKGWAGVVNTLDTLDKAGIAHVGTYRSAEEKAASFIVDIKGIKVAFINYTDTLNIHRMPREYAVNHLEDRQQIVSEARAARAAGADVVVVLLHWGLEYTTKPDARQRSLALGDDGHPGLLDSGVDVILGAHPHVVQPAEGLVQDTDSGPMNKYVVYSMGNFSSDMDRWRTDSGVIVYVQIRKTGEKVEVTGLSYMAVYMQQYGSYPRKVVVEPLLPGTVPSVGSVSAGRQKRQDEIWQYLTDMYYDPNTNILPLDPSRLSTDVGSTPVAM